MKSYHFSLGNSSEGPIGFCARIKAESPEAALDILKDALPGELRVRPLEAEDAVEYIEAYFNADAMTVADIDEDDDEDAFESDFDDDEEED